MQEIKNPAIVRSAEGSVTPTGIYCLFDNEKRVMLSRHVEAIYGMTEQQYIEYCGLPAEYPMTADAYRHEKARLASGSERKYGFLRITVGAEVSSGPEIVRDRKGSVSRDLIYCLFDGEGFPFPERHIKEKYGMDWEDYLAYCGLPADYPSVSPSFSGDDRFLDF
ncbi:hypothetical protein HFO56_01580 [Rhizobium laguerreae]|uniref:MucR family transcriptional regulator n=1 Tax=Rhizobium laguerreae TaxID=1076926 RepID=UPI001C91BAB5|nr:MucR family transcriptional regulator [Rhizobium laguerreae]MBY3151101.1 hypothetical protein [Rhizobium laguerreae]